MSRGISLTPAIAGFVIAFALVMGRLTRPDVILHWLDITGEWDVTMFVFSCSASMVYAVAFRWGRARARSGTGPAVPDLRGAVDARLVIGASVFGVGWAIAGVCPGPVLVSVGAGAPWAFTFLVAMTVGLRLGDRLRARGDVASRRCSIRP